MLEDGIQYMGTRIVPASAAPSPMPPFPSPQSPVTGKDRRHKSLFNGPSDEHPPSGVILHVEANSGQPAHSMTFHRSQTTAVIIGRKSSSDNKIGRSDENSGSAGFACQVVSGKHAKLAFSDSGMVYIIDLRSRHGTHILRPGDTVSRALDPEDVTMLNDGDIITFGKTVGKGSYLVPPVTARVELLFNRSENSAMPLGRIVTQLPITPESAQRSRSGRYGLFVPSLSSPEGSSPSSDDENSRYDHDSDIEEIPPPQSNPEHVGGRTVFPHSLPVLPMLRSLQAQCHGEIIPDSQFPFSPLDEVRLPAIDRHLEQSRSHSPMDLSSSPSTPVAISLPSNLTHSPLIKYYEVESDSQHDSDESSNEDNEQDAEGDVEEIEESSSPLFTEVVFSHSRAASRGPSPQVVDYSKPSSDHANESRSPSPPSEFDLQGHEKLTYDKMVEVNATINQMQRDIAEAVSKRNSQEPVIVNDPQNDDHMESLQGRVADAEILSSKLDDRLDVTEDQVASLQQHVSKLQHHTDALAPTLRDETAETLAEVKAGVASLNALMSQMKTLHEDMEKQMTTKLAAVEAARIALTAATSDAKTISLKRKHSDMEADEASSVNFDAVVVPASDMIDRPRKRARKIVASVVHTATAVAIGAVATWSALAFS